MSIKYFFWEQTTDQNQVLGIIWIILDHLPYRLTNQVFPKYKTISSSLEVLSVTLTTFSERLFDREEQLLWFGLSAYYTRPIVLNMERDGKLENVADCVDVPGGSRVKSSCILSNHSYRP